MTDSLRQRPTVGRPAPPVELLDADGSPWRLRDRRGRSVILIFHRHIH
jgi:peroxiredoxin